MSKYLSLFLLICLFSCNRHSEDLSPKINYVVQDRYIKGLPSAFPPLNREERSQEWGREMVIGRGFAKELDLYQAMTSFKRAEFLLSPDATDRKLEIDYDVLFSFYLGQKYLEVAHSFERSDLKTAPASFPAHKDLMIILYDSYNQLNQTSRAQNLLPLIQKVDSTVADKLQLSRALQKANFPELEQSMNPDVQQLLTDYKKQKKSVGTAQALNAILPGAGYLYLGQPQSAFTAFLLNGLFIGATVYFFQHHNIPAGVIFASFEAGWYFGGIHGAAQEAKFYNERLYENLATPMMNRNGLFPLLMLSHAF